MTYKYIDVKLEGRLTVITLQRPEAHNALHFAAHEELHRAFNEFASDDEQWVAIITGSGAKAFCAGHDLKQQASDANLGTPPSGFGGLASRFDLNKPVIAAVNGVAMGGGFELALACDIIVATQNAAFALPEVKVGLAALAGGMQRLPSLIGLKRSMGMLLTGRRVSASEGVQLGFVNEVVEGDVMDAARRWAADILACSPLSVRATKAAVTRGVDVPVSQAMQEQWDYPEMQKMLNSQDAIEGPKAFAEKRPPRWVGF
ncbi:enoyl-CoA hydratase [Pseudomonas sp. BN505]|uniref:enoyl-CoA hydratase-related protein n=1 Tax=unclassified Pseudomonas TaxID=196821 RepID=UPI0024583B03|nr:MULTISPECIES: enoyl-CoA hydratase-related protein [unclassified Pseudomonas]MDH4842278.1 enoyl-CoA hydratase [Pseudomonas sp. BN605]MDH4855133.1 enoyl-CoA hydratase [Pseudomonas sp. BN505]